MRSAGTAILALLFLLAASASPLFLYISLGLPPCERESAFTEGTRLAIPFALFASAVWLGLATRRPRLADFAAALAIPGAALGAYALAGRLEDGRQAACAKRNLAQARLHCGVNPAHVRAGKDAYGNATLTLVAPGRTDEAWNCLWTWTLHNGSVSLIIDESVYEHYRRTHGYR